MSLSDRKIPVFVFPTSLKFYVTSRSTHKQLLTLYNPYDFPVRFKVLCTAPNKYAVIDPEGSIGPQSCTDIVIRHTAPLTMNCNVTDKFRISMQDHVTKQVIGKRDIEAVLHQDEKDNSSTDGDHFHSVPYSDKGSVIEDQRNLNFIRHRPPPLVHSTNYFVAIVVGIVCAAALLLPTEQEAAAQESKIPSYLYVTINLKLVLAYVLGLVSMVIFRP